MPANPNPARVINLSLAGGSGCSSAYASAIAEIRQAGALIVAAAGNETSPVEEPASCPGVLAVAGIRHAGTKVSYSSYGPEVGISAPAGNCVNILSGQPCLFPFVNTINFGSTTPAGNGYTGIYDVTIGTSFAVPLVAGTAALMIAANPALGEADVMARIKASATAFPADPALPTCPTVTSDGQCNCTTTTCGAGVLNAAAAVSLALGPLVDIGVSGSTVSGSTITLTADSSTTLVSWQWAQISGPASGSFGSANSATTTFTPPVAGSYQIRLTVTDSNGRSISTDTSLSVTAPPSSGGGATDPISLAALLALALLAACRRLRH